MEKKISLVIIGAGYMAKEHIKAFSGLENVVISGIHSRTSSRANDLASEFNIPNVCLTIPELFEKTNANAVIVTTPELETRDICLEIFKYPWTCLIEKPVGYNFEEAEFLHQRANDNKAKVFVALNRRHYGSTLNVLEDLKLFPDKRILQILDQEDLIGARKAGQPELVVNNWMYANAIHIVDYMNIFLRGDVIDVQNILPWNKSDPSYVVSKILYSSGDIALYQCMWNVPGPWAVTLTTRMRRWELRPLEQVAYQDFGQRKVIQIEKTKEDIDFKPGLRQQAREFLKAIQGMKHTLPDLSDALKSMNLIKKIYEL